MGQYTNILTSNTKSGERAKNINSAQDKLLHLLKKSFDQIISVGIEIHKRGKPVLVVNLTADMFRNKKVLEKIPSKIDGFKVGTDLDVETVFQPGSKSK